MTFATTPLKNRSVKELEFLTGHWKGFFKEDIVEEYWLPELDSNKACVFRWIKNGEIYIYEIVALMEQDDEIHMFLRHFDKNFNAWEDKDSPRDFIVTELTDCSVVFIDSANPDNGFLRYDTSKENTLTFFDHEPDGTVNFSLIFDRQR